MNQTECLGCGCLVVDALHCDHCENVLREWKDWQEENRYDWSAARRFGCPRWVARFWEQKEAE